MKDIRERFKKMTPEELEEALRRTAERDKELAKAKLVETGSDYWDEWEEVYSIALERLPTYLSISIDQDKGSSR